jgi:hypothetical protein
VLKSLPLILSMEDKAMLDKQIAGFLVYTAILVIVAVRETYTQTDPHAGASAHEQISNNVPAKPKLDLRTFVADKASKPKSQTATSTDQKQLQAAKERAMPDSSPWFSSGATIVLIALVVWTVGGVVLVIHRGGRRSGNNVEIPLFPTK